MAAESGPIHGAKMGWNALKSHWLFFAILILLLVLLAVGYDKKNGTFSSWRAKLATWPLVGPLFAAFALVFFGAARVIARLHGVA